MSIKKTFTCEVENCKGTSEGVMCAICNRWICYRHAFRNIDISDKHFCEEHWHGVVMKEIEHKPIIRRHHEVEVDMFPQIPFDDVIRVAGVK